MKRVFKKIKNLAVRAWKDPGLHPLEVRAIRALLVAVAGLVAVRLGVDVMPVVNFLLGLIGG